jgi:hypothetical protein
MRAIGKLTVKLLAFMALEIGWFTGFSQDSGAQVPQELVGKWCYYNLANGDEGNVSGTCVTLNGDGSYEFYLDGSMAVKLTAAFPGIPAQESDYGTWSVTGNVIQYISQSHGQGSFRFQKMNQPTNPNTPMIVLNGHAFVATTAHDAW